MANKPEIRFKEFNDDWEQRKLGDLGNIVTGSTPPTKDKSNYDGEYLFVSPADIQGNRFVNNTITTLTEKGFNKGRILKEGTTLFVSIGSTIGKVAQTIEKSTTNQQINAIESSDKYDKNFVFTLMENCSGRIKNIAATQAVPIVNKTTFWETEIIAPVNFEEQQKIGIYFKNLDNLITLHQHKCDELVKVKNIVADDIFNQKIKFKKDDGTNYDEWKVVTLGKLCIHLKTNTLTTDKLNKHGKYPVINGGKELYGYYDNFNIDGDAITISSRGDAGYVRYVKEKFWAGGLCYVYKSLTNSTECIAYCLKNNQNNIKNQFQQGNSIPAVNKEDVDTFKFLFPTSLEEQKKIADTLSSIDNLIEIERKKTEKLKEIKKIMLNKMFCV